MSLQNFSVNLSQVSVPFASGTLATMAATTGTDGELFYNTTYKHYFKWMTDRWWPLGNPDPRYGFIIYDEFLSAGTASDLAWTAAGTVNIGTGTATNPGLFVLRQATASSRSSLTLSAAAGTGNSDLNVDYLKVYGFFTSARVS